MDRRGSERNKLEDGLRAAGEQACVLAVFNDSLFFLDKNVIGHTMKGILPAEERMAALERVCRQIGDGERADACAYLADLADWAQREWIPLPELQAAVDRVTLALTGAALQAELPAGILRDFYSRMQREGRSRGELIRRLRTDLSLLARELSRLQQAQNDLLDRMLAYIEQFGMDYDFSVQAMADAFSVPQTELSRLFQYRTGQKLGAYLWESRLREAKRLLACTDLPVREVVRRVGYVDTSSFTRKFRRCIGCTPCEYRVYGRQRRGADNRGCAAAI